MQAILKKVGNLVILEEGKYDGGEIGFPRSKVAIDVRHCDFLAWMCMNGTVIPK